jgi:hypothetical protein
VKAVLTLLGCALAAIVAVLVVGGQINGGSASSGSGGGGGGLGAGGRPDVTTGTGGTTDTTPPATGRPRVTASATADSTGTPDVTQRGTGGTDHVDCSAIDSRLKISAHDGPIRWHATASPGVSVSPSSGFLDEGGSKVVRIGGSYSGGRSFTVVVPAPNRTGSGSANVPFTCV